MGFSLKKATKSISRAAKPISKAVSGTVKSVGKVGGSLAKGDIKGVAQGAQGLVATAKDVGKELAKQNLGVTTGALGGLGSLTGIKGLKDVASNISREGTKGVDTYGDTAMDVGANIATGGTYGAAQQALNATAQGGLGALVNPKQLQQAALSAGASYAGIDPNLLKTGMAAAGGDIKGAALQAAGSYAGLDPDKIKMAASVAGGDLKDAALQAAGSKLGVGEDQLNTAKAGLSALSGDKSALASQLASQAGIPKDAANMAGAVTQGKKELMSGIAGKFGLDDETKNILKSVANKDLKGIAAQAINKSGINPEEIKQSIQKKLPPSLGKMLSKVKIPDFSKFQETQPQQEQQFEQLKEPENRVANSQQDEGDTQIAKSPIDRQKIASQLNLPRPNRFGINLPSTPQNLPSTSDEDGGTQIASLPGDVGIKNMQKFIKLKKKPVV